MTRDPRRWVRWPADHPAAGSGADSTWERECCTATVTPAFNGDPEQNTLSIFVLPRNFNFSGGSITYRLPCRRRFLLVRSHLISGKLAGDKQVIDALKNLPKEIFKK